MTDYLTVEDLIMLTRDLGIGPVSDIGLLDSAAYRPTTSLYGHETYPSIDEKSAVLLESILANHPLVDGNKRLGWLAVVVFYGLNGIDLDAPDDEAYGLVIEVASGQPPYADTAVVLRSWH